MNGFDQARGVEARAFMVLRPFLEEQADAGRYVVTDKGRLAPFLQEVVGDVVMNKSGRVWGIELKAEERWTGNLFLETWSNRNLEDPASHAMRGSNPGWMLKTRADLLLYYFIDSDILCVMSTLAVKRWAFGHNGIAGRIYKYDEKRQGRYAQANDTHGRCVPVSVLEQELSPPLKRLRVSQLGLDFGTAAE